MMIRRFLLVVASVLGGALVGGCATYIPPDYVGWRESRVIGELGVPHDTYKSGGLVFIEYRFAENYKTPETQHCEEDGDDTFCITSGGVEQTSDCTLTFTMRNRVVKSFRRRGSDWVCQDYENWERVEQ